MTFSSKINYAPVKKNTIPIRNERNEKGEKNEKNDIMFCKMIKKFKIIDDNTANYNPQIINNNNNFINVNNANNVTNALRIHRDRGRINKEQKPHEESLPEEKIINHSFLDVDENEVDKQFGDLRKKQSKSTSKYEKRTNMKFYNTGLAFKNMKLNFEKPKKNTVINNKNKEKQDLILIKYIFCLKLENLVQIFWQMEGFYREK